MITSIILVVALAAIIILYPLLWWLALVILPFLILGLLDYFQKSNNIKRSYPLFGRIIKLLEKERHVVQENLLLNRTEGKPFNWIQKEIV